MVREIPGLRIGLSLGPAASLMSNSTPAVASREEEEETRQEEQEDDG